MKVAICFITDIFGLVWEIRASSHEENRSKIPCSSVGLLITLSPECLLNLFSVVVINHQTVLSRIA